MLTGCCLENDWKIWSENTLNSCEVCGALYFIWDLGCEIYRWSIQIPNGQYRDHLVGQLTTYTADHDNKIFLVLLFFSFVRVIISWRCMHLIESHTRETQFNQTGLETNFHGKICNHWDFIKFHKQSARKGLHKIQF